ncbi:MAG: hypothetical protein Q9O24_05180 [Gammaproteobacteria bacterium]|nr:hypothetical protein [Gammaproteobacteria bacterium]
MSCCGSKSKTVRQNCPECGQTGLSVSKQTLLHQLVAPDNRDLSDSDYFFCAESSCSLAYFSAQLFFPTSHLRAFTGSEQKRLCYCFDITATEYQSALQEGGAAKIKQFVMAQTKAGLCACEARNPSGRCCLLDFKRLEKRLALG